MVLNLSKFVGYILSGTFDKDRWKNSQHKNWSTLQQNSAAASMLKNFFVSLKILAINVTLSVFSSQFSIQGLWLNLLKKVGNSLWKECISITHFWWFDLSVSLKKKVSENDSGHTVSKTWLRMCVLDLQKSITFWQCSVCWISGRLNVLISRSHHRSIVIALGPSSFGISVKLYYRKKKFSHLNVFDYYSSF